MRSFRLLLALALAGGCAPIALNTQRLSPVTIVRPAGDWSHWKMVSYQHGAEIAVEEISARRVPFFPDLSAPLMAVHYRHLAHRRWSVWTGRPTGRLLTLLPVPSYVVRVVNRSDHPVSFSRDSFQLLAPDGRIRPAYDSGSLQGLMETEIIASIDDRRMPHDWAIQQARSYFGQLPILDSMRVLAPGTEWSGYIAFAGPTEDADCGDLASCCND
jgi:hypothetical protein